MTRTICIFSDGTGQRGVKLESDSTNIFKLYEWARAAEDQICFYDAGVGTEPRKKLDWTTWGRNQFDKATGTGITRNIHDCYDFSVQNWTEGSRLAVFGFSRGAYTVRSLAAAVGLCGIPGKMQQGIDITTKGSRATELRHAILDEAIELYQSNPGPDGRPERLRKAAEFRHKYQCTDLPVHLVAVFDTVAALGLPGIVNLVNPFRFKFHDEKLSNQVPFGFQALSIDENRKIFAAVPWDEMDKTPNQVIDQVWFPGVHSDIGGGYEDCSLSDMTLDWMVKKCTAPEVGIKFVMRDYRLRPSLIGEQHDETTGWGRLWRRGERKVGCLERERDRLCNRIEDRYNHFRDYRPGCLAKHPRVMSFYT